MKIAVGTRAIQTLQISPSLFILGCMVKREDSKEEKKKITFHKMFLEKRGKRKIGSEQDCVVMYHRRNGHPNLMKEIYLIHLDVGKRGGKRRRKGDFRKLETNFPISSAVMISYTQRGSPK